ncbi:MAG: hypothetical protein CFH06_00164 [Alphaproteobacteria bacterium MarineAlpha3_Bin5]|nr:aldehyde-activating protein [Magnetovibrio sp.]PPR80001.1 MAG: hypothetical protein CFH06_00164 [Alphaproteobacteria bacterium MarineAlpha3_Bin5]
MDARERFIGTCHCGAVHIAVPADTVFSNASRCNCSFCRRRWAPNATVPEDQMEVVRGADMLTIYQFHTKVAEHYFCSRCGIYTHHRRRSNPAEFGVNVTCFDHIDMSNYDRSNINNGIDHPKDRKSPV